MKGLIALIIVIVALVAVFVLVALGIITIPGLQGVGNDLFGNNEKNYPDATFCDYTEMQILDMIEIAAGKDLNNQIGVSYVRALNMKACAVNDKTPGSILSYYVDSYSDWYTYFNNQDAGSGYTVQTVIWTNSPAAVNSTLAKSVVIVDGITVEQAYGYDSIVISSDGPVATYVAFIAWINAS